MFCKKTMKKISAAALSAVLGMSLSFSAVSMPEASAIGLGDVVGIGIGAAQAAQQKEQVMITLNIQKTTLTDIFKNIIQHHQLEMNC